MSGTTWVVVLMLAAAFLPAVLLGLVAAGDRISAHPRYRAFSERAQKFQAKRPYASAMITGAGAIAVGINASRAGNWTVASIVAVGLTVNLVATHFLQQAARAETESR